MLWKNGRYAVAFATTAALKTGKEPDSASTEPAKPQDVLNSLTESAVRRYMIQKGIPGLTIGLTYNGKLIYSAGFGYSDVETGGKCNAQTVMRIASISKPITATVTALLLRDGKVELDKSIHSYISEKVFPKKSYDGRSVDITLRQLLSHTGGVRHYEKPSLNQKEGNEQESKEMKKVAKAEFMSNKVYPSVSEALSIFNADPLIAEPGKTYSYTTHGFTLVSAILEAASGKKYPDLAAALFRQLGMSFTSLDQNPKIVPNRTRYYVRNQRHELENCAEVDNSCKWAGGGIQSTVGDLLKLANGWLYGYQRPNRDGLTEALLPKEIIEEFWKGEIVSAKKADYFQAGLGWFRVNGPAAVGGLRSNPTFWYHSGAAVGASSILLIAPAGNDTNDEQPRGLCIAILCNLQEVDLYPLATEIKALYSEYSEQIKAKL